jgi:3,4-dihydroxy 2-butanone 4-phosphate synthase/GTP cyclohydrolase II
MNCEYCMRRSDKSQKRRGVLVYMRQEGRGIGLAAKIHAYKFRRKDRYRRRTRSLVISDLRDWPRRSDPARSRSPPVPIPTNNPESCRSGGIRLRNDGAGAIRSEANQQPKISREKDKLGHLL